jgi:hypothetical protein
MTSIQPTDLGFFSTLASAGSLSAAARELGITTPAVSKHLALMESRVGLSLGLPLPVKNRWTFFSHSSTVRDGTTAPDQAHVSSS